MQILNYPEHHYTKRPYNIIDGKRTKYIDIFGCFDIETTLIDLSNDGQEPDYLSFMYIWQYCDNTDTVYVGRTWTDLQNFMSEISMLYDLSTSKLMVWYVHNLPFEFQFLRSVVAPLDVFATAPRKVVKFNTEDGIQFRCSYTLTNMSLSKFCESQQTGYEKQKGFDYSILRYPDTPITGTDLKYCIYDVISLHASLEKLMLSENDDVKTIPLTSTGYVRREAREKTCDNNAKRLLYRTQLDNYRYKMCKAATRGGNTHANYLYTGQLLKNIYSYDRSSSYPHVMVTGNSYPVTRYIVEKNASYLERMPTTLSCIGTVEYVNLQLKPNQCMPYLPFSRAIAYQRPKWNDNGRVLSCERFIIALTEIDYEIVEKMYDYDKVIIHDLMVADKGKLPKKYRDFVMEMYIRKSELKYGDAYFYMKIKNKLNSLFGMMLTDVTREEVVYQNDQWLDNILPDIDKELKKYYNNPKSFLEYQNGLYVTALARKELQRSIDICGIDTVYVDTDSNKHRNDHSADFAKLNAEIHAENLSNDIVPIVTVNGKQFEMGIWEDEGNGSPEYEEFITMGAKKYAYKYPSGKYGVTVAGLSKTQGAKLLEEQGLETFSTGLVFNPSYSGRLTAKYDDIVRLEKVSINGHICEITSNVSLIPTSYTLGLEKNYEQLVHAAIQGNVN